MIHQIESGEFGGNGKSNDLEDHKQIAAGCDKFLDRCGFRKAFPTAAHLYSALGDKCYESWQQYLENVRICDEVDFAAISGWESIAIENHSGIVDNLRNFKGNSELIASSLQPIRPVVKQHKLCYAFGESALFDLYLLNDTSLPISGRLHFSIIEPGGKSTELASWPVPPNIADQLSYTIQTAFAAPVFSRNGIYRFQFKCDAAPKADFTRDVWVINTQPGFARKFSIGVSRVLPAVRRQLSQLIGVEITESSAQEHYDLIVSSGVVAGSMLDRTIGDETGLEIIPTRSAPSTPQVPGQIAEEVLSALRAGTPLLAIAPDFSAPLQQRWLANSIAFLTRTNRSVR